MWTGVEIAGGSQEYTWNCRRDLRWAGLGLTNAKSPPLLTRGPVEIARFGVGQGDRTTRSLALPGWVT